jgi:hypothetical protein
MVGCYAQTEMGHGSDVQSLETVAVFDKDTDSFILDSPTLTSTKMWPGKISTLLFKRKFPIESNSLIDFCFKR